MLVSRFLLYNKIRTTNMILCVTLTTTLLLSISIIFSSVHQYLVQTTLKQNNYHVYFESENFKTPSYIKTKTYQNKINYIKYKDINKIKQHTKEICKKIKCQKITYNKKLLSLYGKSKKNSLKTIKNILLTVLTVLAISSFILIKNSFNITLIERQKEIGLLKNMGMTNNQILVLFLEEATIILMISQIIAIIISLWFSQILLFIINTLLKEIFKIKLIIKIYPMFITISYIFIIMTFYFSVLIPIKKISRKSIISLLNENHTFKTKRIPKYIHLLNPIKVLAFSNYYRLKKKYRPIKLSIMTSIILYISFSLYLNYGINSINKLITIPNYDFLIETKGSKNNYNQLKKFSKKYKKYKIYLTCNTQGKIDNQSYKNKIYKQNNVVIVKSKKERIINYIKIKNTKQKYLKNKVKLQIDKQITVNTINSIPFGLESKITNDNIVFLTNNINNYCNEYTLQSYIKDKKIEDKDLTKLKIKDNIIYTNIKKATKLTNNFSLAIKLSLYSILILVIIITISLILSTYNLIVHARKKEFSILKSIGTTNFNIKKILLVEVTIILFKIFMYIIPISYLISYILHQNINKIITINFISPNKELLISAILTFLIIYYSLNKNYNKIKKI